MRRLLIVALMLAGLVAPPAVLAQIGSPPGIGSPPFSTASPTFTGTASSSNFAAGSGTQAAPSYGVTGWSGLGWYRLPRTTFPTHAQFAVTGSSGAAPPIAIFRNNASTTNEFFVPAQDATWKSSGTGEYAFTVSSALTGGIMEWQSVNCSAPPCWSVGRTYTAASAMLDATVLQVGVSVGTTADRTLPGVVAVGGNASYPEGLQPLGAFAFHGTNIPSSSNGLFLEPAADPGAVRNTIEFPIFSGTVLLSTTANTPDTGNAVWANTGSFLFEGPTANAFETELDVVDPTEDRTIFLPNDSGAVVLRRDQSLTTTSQRNLLQVPSGYVIDTATVSNEEDVAVTVVDTTPSLNAGQVDICGYATAAAEAAGSVVCSPVDFSGGAGTAQTGNTWWKILTVKGHGLGVLGGGGDETIEVAWATALSVIVTTTDLVNHAASSVTIASSDAGFHTIACIDPLGCEVSVDAPVSNTEYGRETLFHVMSGSSDITFTDGGSLRLSATHTLDADDTLRLLFDRENNTWVQVSVSEN